MFPRGNWAWCMVALFALEIQCFFLAGAICEKEGNWLLVLGATQGYYNLENEDKSIESHCKAGTSMEFLADPYSICS